MESPTSNIEEDGIESKAREYLQSFLNNWLSIRNVDRDIDHLFHMLKKHPGLAKVRFEGKASSYRGIQRFPLVFLLDAKAPLEMIQEVHEMNPDAIQEGKEDYLRLPCPLHWAIRSECSSDVIQFLVETFPASAGVVNRDNFLPIELLYENISGEENIDQVSFGKSFQSLYNAFPPSKWLYPVDWTVLLTDLMGDPNTPPALLSWLAKKGNKYGSSIQIRLDLPVKTSYTTCIRNLKHFVPMLSCNKLTFRLDNGRTDDADFLGNLLGNVNVPSALALEFVGFDVNLPEGFEDLVNDWSSCQLQELSITEFRATKTEDFMVLIKSLSALPKLKQLTIRKSRRNEKVACTDAVTGLLEKTNLQKLFMTGGSLEIDVKQLSQFLQESKSVAFVGYSSAAAKNTSYNYEVAFQSAMNLHGRASITKPNATCAILADGLSSVECSYAGDELQTKLEVSVLYGLLCIAPGLWAANNGDPQRAKKRPNEEPSLGFKNAKKMK